MFILVWLKSAFTFVANSKPAQYALMIVGAILAFKTVQMKARMDGEKIANAKNKVQREAQIAHQRQETAERVEAFNEAARDIERLPEPELRERTETDPNNRGRVQRN